MKRSSLTCVRLIPQNGPSALWTRGGRDAERKRDNLRCGCGQPWCRDAELEHPLPRKVAA